MSGNKDLLVYFSNVLIFMKQKTRREKKKERDKNKETKESKKEKKEEGKEQERDIEREKGGGKNTEEKERETLTIKAKSFFVAFTCKKRTEMTQKKQIRTV